MIIDLHAHVWPDHIARRALRGNIPDMSLVGDGTVTGLLAAAGAAAVDRTVCLAVANTPQQVEPANAFVGGCDRQHLIPFGTVHPSLSPEENLASLERHQVAGVKLHPIFQGYRLDDPALFDVLSALSGRLPVIVHVGAGAGSDGAACTPQMLARIVRTFPSLDVIACHLGGYHMFEAAEAVRGLNIYLDTSWPPSLDEIDPEAVRTVIRRHGPERVLFASDWPTADPTREIAAVRRLGLRGETTAAILGGNAARLLGFDAAG
jgi:predicted TIM-barrel fold metal-dependent hydrolase